MHPILKKLIELVMNEKLDPKKEATAIAVIETIKEELQPLRPKERDAYERLSYLRQDFKIQLPERIILDEKDEMGQTTLIYTARHGHTSIAAKLVDAKVTVDIQDKKGNTALIHAASRNQSQMVTMLLEAKAALDIQNNQGTTALMRAVTKDHTEIATQLIEAKANPNVKDETGCVALMHAVIRNNTDIVTKLIDAKAAPDIRDHAGNTALIYAAQWHASESVTVLIKANAAVNIQNSKDQTALISASNLGSTIIVAKLLDAKAKPDIQDEDGNTALMHAVAAGYTEIVTLLLNAKASLELKNTRGFTALHRAILCEHPEIAINLIDAKAMLDVQTNNGNTALIILGSYGDTKIVEKLIAAKAKLDIQGEYGNTALIAAISGGHTEIAIKLILAGANHQIINNNGYTAFDYAVARNNLALVCSLLEHGAKIENVSVFRSYLLGRYDNLHQIDFCWGTLLEQEENFAEARIYYESALSRRSYYPTYPPACRRLGEMLEKKENISAAVTRYNEALQLGDRLSLSRLVSVAEKLAGSVSRDSTTSESEMTRVDYTSVTTQIYSHLLLTGMHSYLPVEQWIFLALDALGNSYFQLSDDRHLMEGIQFALRAARKAEELARSEEEKNAAAEITRSTWGIFRQVINPLHGTLIEEKGDHQEQLDALARISMRESASIIGSFLDDQEIEAHMKSILVPTSSQRSLTPRSSVSTLVSLADDQEIKEEKRIQPEHSPLMTEAENKDEQTRPFNHSVSIVKNKTASRSFTPEHKGEIEATTYIPEPAPSPSSTLNLRKSLFNTAFSALATLGSLGILLGVAWNPVGWVSLISIGIVLLLSSTVMLSIKNKSILKGIFLSLTPGLNILWSLGNVIKDLMTDRRRSLPSPSSVPPTLDTHPTSSITTSSTTYTLNSRIPIPTTRPQAQTNFSNSQASSPLLTSENTLTQEALVSFPSPRLR